MPRPSPLQRTALSIVLSFAAAATIVAFPPVTGDATAATATAAAMADGRKSGEHGIAAMDRRSDSAP
jgi:hypothetical protein